MKLKKVMTEMVLDILSDMHSLLKTRLPYPWDFCRVELEESTRLTLNSVSYLVIYSACIYWFINYVLKEIRSSVKKDLSRKDCCIVMMLAFATATKILWPFFLLAMWFISCSFYPWTVALAVFSLNFPLEAQYLFNLTTSFISQALEAAEETELEIQAPEEFVHEEVYSSDEEYAENLTSFSLPIFVEARSEEGPSLSAETLPLTSTPRRASRLEKCRFDDIAQETISTVTSNKKDITLSTSLVTDIHDVSREKYQEFMTVSSARNVKQIELEGERDNILNKKMEEKYIHRGIHKRVAIPSPRKPFPDRETQMKKGYCGRCWRGNGLPFKPGFTGLRDPYTTRSGYIYGPTVRFMKMCDYIREYGL